MTARGLGGTLAVVSFVLAGSSFAAPASAGDKLTTVGVRNGASEFSFALSRTRVSPGPALIQYTNTGEDPHDVRIQRKGSDAWLELPETLPGAVSAFPEMRLRRDSRYILWCSLDGHRESGMEARLRVRKRR